MKEKEKKPESKRPIPKPEARAKGVKLPGKNPVINFVKGNNGRLTGSCAALLDVIKRKGSTTLNELVRGRNRRYTVWMCRTLVKEGLVAAMAEQAKAEKTKTA